MNAHLPAKPRALARRLAVALLVVNALVCAPLARAVAPPAQQTPALPAGIVRVTSVEGITEYRLPNGLRVLMFPDQTKQTITVNITYLVGSSFEDYGETGMAHLLEHMTFKGTPHHPNIPQELTAHGARPNGTTWADRTNYFETFAATDENLNWALDLESDRMVNSYIAKKDLDSEMTVVRNEFELGENDPANVLTERMMATAYLWHNYGKTTIGARSDIENVPIERLQAFYHRYYQPDNSVLTIAGKFDEAKTLALVDKYFSPIPRPTRTLQKIYTVEPVQDGERAVTLRRTGDTQVVQALYHVPSGAHPDFAAVDIIARVLGDNTSGRLHKALVETKKASAAYGYDYQWRDPTLAIFGAEVRQGDSLDAARDALIETVEGIGANPPTKEEIERARAQILKGIDLTLNNSDRVGLTLSEYIGAGDWRLFFLHRDRVRKVTPEDVARVAAAYFKPSNRTLGLFIPTAKPDRAEIPPTPDVAAMLKDYKGDAVVAAGEAFDPSPANIESRTTREDAGGLKMALLPKKTRGGSVVAQMTLRYGDEKSLMNRSTAAALAGAMLMRGTTKHTRQQIQDELDRLKARAFVFGGPTQAGVQIETTRENLPAVMRLVAEVLREPSFPADEFEQLKRQQLAAIEQQRSEPTQIAFTAFNRTLSPYPKGDVRYVSTPDEDVAEIGATTLDDAKQFYKDFYGASNATLTVVGDFDKDEVAKLAKDLFGDWKSPRPFTRVPSVYKDVAPVNQSFNAPDKANAFFAAGLNLNIRDDSPDYPALVLGNYMLGGGFLNSRLATRIRQKEGLSYGVGSGLSISSFDQYGRFMATAIYAPQNVNRLEAAFKDEIARMLRDGFTAEEVEAAKSGFLQSRQVSRAQDNELASRLNGYLFLGRTLQWDADLEAKIKALTPEQINAAMRKYIDPAKITIVKSGDFAKAAATANQE
ncbi:MAG TPA: pitrilysin family protein [Pyrinomonadaceae bacterium]|nr:pitrilysin family protein [Pyrinomonadaceae bacterium]